MMRYPMICRVKYLMTDPVCLLTVRIFDLLKELNCLLNILSIVKSSETFNVLQYKSLGVLVLDMVQDVVNYQATTVIQAFLISCD